MRERAVVAIVDRIRCGAVDADGWPLMLGGRATCTAEEVAEAQRRVHAAHERKRQVGTGGNAA